MSSAERMYERAKRTKAGWRLAELRRLYVGFGFDVEEGAKHIMFIHPKFPQLRATVTRKRSLAVGYIETAVESIAALKRLEEGKGKR